MNQDEEHTLDRAIEKNERLVEKLAELVATANYAIKMERKLDPLCVTLSWKHSQLIQRRAQASNFRALLKDCYKLTQELETAIRKTTM